MKPYVKEERLVPVIVSLMFVVIFIFGGASRSGLLGHLFLQLLGCGILLFLVNFVKDTVFTQTFRRLAFLVGGIVIWSFLQLVPLPMSIWTSFGDRAFVESGYQILKQQGEISLPISLTPGETFASILGFIPPIAVFMTLYSIGWRRSSKSVSWALVILAGISVIIGFAQLFTGDESPLYWHSVTNNGYPVGFFANVNHNATLVLMAIPFLAVLGYEEMRTYKLGGNNALPRNIIAFLLVLFLSGIVLMDSVAGYILIVPSLAAAILLYQSRSTSLKSILLTYLKFGLALALLMLILAYVPILDRLGITNSDDTELSRIEVWKQSLSLVRDNYQFGSGLGSYEHIYRVYEDSSGVSKKYMNDAHNDYLQIVIEWGIIGAILLICVGILIIIEIVKQWTGPREEGYRIRRAASVALLMIMCHSFVDYPLRTPALACVTAACLALLLMPYKDIQSRARKRSREIKNEKRVVI